MEAIAYAAALAGATEELAVLDARDRAALVVCEERRQNEQQRRAQVRRTKRKTTRTPGFYESLASSKRA